MNIAVVTPAWPQVSSPNGIVTYYSNLVPALRALGHNVYIITFKSYENSSEVQLIDYGLSLLERFWCKFKQKIEPGYKQYYVGSRGIKHALKTICDKNSIDIVQMEESFGWHFHVQKHFSFPIVLRLNGPYFLNTFEKTHSLQTRKRLARERQGFKAADYVTAPSASALTLTREKYNCDWRHAEVRPNSMNAFELGERWSWDSIVENQILFVGRFDKHKGADILLHAFFKILQRYSDAKLIFVGPDNGLDEDGEKLSLKSFMEKHGYDSDTSREAVLFLGHQDRKTIEKYRRTSHITVVTSRYETFGNVGLEALASGSPVICSSVGGFEEVVQHGKSGLLFENENIEDLTAKIDSLLGSKELAIKLSNGAIERTREGYYPPDSAQALIDFFEKVLSLHNS